ncbi:PAP2 superfamily protein [uncultured Mycobacterium sp.]|uniref:PAP2 superfamily protein n=1 Tax=uncultured Mycobacterium sp. TaxID=171292 RepID=A0A1Y5PKY4_9MYCO|nr:PAP2 superfamily protein [uncultured Mycobacterium sp.]
MGQPYGPGSLGFGILGAVVLAALLVWSGVAIWVARHRCVLVAAVNRLRATAAFGGMRSWATRYLGAPVAALARRLSVDIAGALALMSGVVLVALLAAGFTELLDDVLDGELTMYVDQPVSQWVAAHRDLWLTDALKVLTHLGDAGSLVVIVIIVSAWTAWRSRSWLPAVLGLSGLVGTGVMLVVAKWVVGRTRPPSWIAVIVEDGFSFPSGHATGTFTVAVLGAWMTSRWVLHDWAARVALWAIFLGAAGLVGFSRIYLGVHYVSDVVAGAFLGAAWAVAVIVVGAWWQSSRRSAQPAPSPG